jgi:TonB family protein
VPDGANCETSPKDVDSIPEILRDSVRHPYYPDAAKVKFLNGKVHYVFTINADGTLSNIKQFGEDPPNHGFGAASLAVVQNLRYKPAMKNGVPVTVDCWPFTENFQVD